MRLPDPFFRDYTTRRNICNLYHFPTRVTWSNFEAGTRLLNEVTRLAKLSRLDFIYGNYALAFHIGHSRSTLFRLCDFCCGCCLWVSSCLPEVSKVSAGQSSWKVCHQMIAIHCHCTVDLTTAQAFFVNPKVKRDEFQCQPCSWCIWLTRCLFSPCSINHVKSRIHMHIYSLLYKGVRYY